MFQNRKSNQKERKAEAKKEEGPRKGQSNQ
jgi:hypothetical protein